LTITLTAYKRAAVFASMINSLGSGANAGKHILASPFCSVFKKASGKGVGTADIRSTQFNVVTKQNTKRKDGKNKLW
jgi:hypothetical protein